MAFHLALFHASLAGNAAITQLVALGDQGLSLSGNGYLVPVTLPKIMRAAGVGALLMRAQLNSGSLREFTPFDLSPVNVGALIGSPAAFQDWSEHPLPLKPEEELDAFILNSGVGPTRTTVAVWLCDGPVRPVLARPFTVRWTSAVALAAAFAWSSITPVFDNPLPSGVFALVGSRLQSATGLFHRYLPKGPGFRPGTFCTQTDAAVEVAGDRYGKMGEWMRFTNTTVPAIEEFAGLADAAQSGYMDLIQVG